MEKLIIIGGGAGEWEQITLKALDCIEHAAHTVVQTERMPLFANLKKGQIPVTSLDCCYETAEDFDALNSAVVQALSALNGTVCYVVYGSGTDDCTAAYAAKQADAAKIPVTILPGVSLENTVLAALKCPGRVFTSLAEDFDSAHVDTSHPALYTCIDNKLMAGTLKCALSEWYDDEQDVFFYHEDARGCACIQTFPLYELDRLPAESYDHTACVFLPSVALTAQHGYGFHDLIKIMQRLRDPDGCPWDREQTHDTLKRYLLEECYEALDAIDEGAYDALCDELGDVLLQVAFHAQIGSEEGEFNIYDVIGAICRKMIRRHPHIFSDTEVKNSSDVLQNWDAIKRQEKKQSSISETLEEIPRSMAALMRAEKACDRARKAVSAPSDTNLSQLLLGAAEQATQAPESDTIGRLLFLTCLLANEKHIQPELALNRQTDRFIQAFCKTSKATQDLWNLKKNS